MNDLGNLSLVIGCILAALCAPCALIPKTAAEWIRRFPRNILAAWILTAADLLWVAWLLFHIHIGRIEGVDFEALKPLLFILMPIALFLITQFMDELLAARALGGLFLLIPAPLLSVARWNELSYSLVIVILAYIMVVAGVLLVLNPYLFRKMSSRWAQDEKLCRAVGVIGMTFGVVVVCLAAFSLLK